MYNWKEVLDYINGEIAGMSFERQPAELYEPIRYVLSMGGETHPAGIDADGL